MNPDRLWTTSLQSAPKGMAVTRILSAALSAVEPAAAVYRFLQRDGMTLRIAEQTYDLTQYQRVFVVGAGKAGTPMAYAVADVLGDYLHAGCVVVKEGHASATPHDQLTIIEAGHPVPDARGVSGGQQVAELLAQTNAHDLVITVISGGGSALLTRPVDGVSLADLQSLTATLLRCGASIDEINTLRKHLDQVKGGGLAQLAHPATVITLILSDVVGNPLNVIASGPTVPDPTTFADSLAITERYDVAGQMPPSIMDYLKRGLAGDVPETLKPEDAHSVQVQNVLIGSNELAAEAALAAAQDEGFQTMLLTTFVQGEAREIGRALAAIGRALAATGRPLARPACIIVGGETTVTLRGDGRGGRNQELALASVADLAGLADIALVTLATDGGDGPTDAAGAVVTGETFQRAQAMSLDPADHLARNDAYPFFAALGDLLLPGPTHTNVNDLAFVFAF
ncbi:MAG: glycerate kinase [Chloroflexota bacterium]